MSVIRELIRTEGNGTISFGNYELPEKSKLDDYEFDGDVYKIKTFRDITKLERNGLFVYESVPGTVVKQFDVTEAGVRFWVEGSAHAQITLGLEADSVYAVSLAGVDTGEMKTNLGGKLSLSLDLSEDEDVQIIVEKL